MSAKFDAVLFDFDGTIADTGVAIFNSARFAIAAMGFQPISEKVLKTFVGPPLVDSFKRELGMTHEQSCEAVEKYRDYYSKRAIFQFELYPGIENLLKKLKENGVKIGIASSKPEKFIVRIIEHIGFEKYFDFVSAPTQDVPVEKSELILNAVSVLGVTKEKTIMIGDRHFDINGANVAGVKSIGAAYGYGSKDELAHAGATYIVDSVFECDKILFG